MNFITFAPMFKKPIMIKRFYIVLILALPLVFSCIKSDKEDEVENYVTVGSSLPEFIASDLEDNDVNTAELDGKRVVVLLFYTTCPTCQEELPKIEACWKTLKEEPDVVFLPISREEEKDVVSAYWSTQKFTMPVYLDVDRSIYKKFANMMVPRIYLVDPQGKITWMHIGTLELSTEELIQKIEELSAK